jgi:hypothetical protein
MCCLLKVESALDRPASLVGAGRNQDAPTVEQKGDSHESAENAVEMVA